MNFLFNHQLEAILSDARWENCLWNSSILVEKPKVGRDAVRNVTCTIRIGTC